MDQQRGSTAEPPGHPDPSGQHEGPRVTADQMGDMDRLRRSTSDRYIAGVAGGLGRHFDIDPTVIRVLLGVLTFFGGAGVLVYAVVWLFVPEDGHQRAAVDVNPDVRRVILIVVGALALSAVVSTPFVGDNWGSDFPLPLLGLALVAVALFATRDRRRAGRTPPAPWGSVPVPPAPTSTSDPRGTTMPSTYTGPAEGTRSFSDAGQQPPAWMPPQSYAPLPPPRPRRTGLVLFWPTLALIAIALGTLGILDVGEAVAPSAYFALALAVVAAMLLIGAFVGRPGGLIALGLLASLGLGATSAVEAATDWETGGETLNLAPRSARALQDVYTVPNGQITLDLTTVRDLEALDGRTIDLSLNAGEIEVILPRGIDANVDAQMHVVGGITLDGSERGGLDQSMSRTITGSAPDAPTITLDLEARVGQITVTQD